MTPAPVRQPLEGISAAAEKTRWFFLLLTVVSGYASVAVSQICLGVALLAGLVLWRRVGISPPRTGMEKPSFVLALWALAMVPVSTFPEQSAVCYRRFYLFAALWIAASVAVTERRRGWLLGALGIGAVGVGIFGLGSSLLKTGSLFLARSRVVSNPMTTGVLMMMALLVAVGFLLTPGLSRRWRIPIAAAAVPVLLGLVQSMTRSALIGAAFGVVLILALTRHRIVGILLIGVVAGAVLFQGPAREILPDRLERRFTPEQIRGSKSFRDRIEMWTGAWEMVKAHPITGVGDRGIYEIAPQYYGDENTQYYGHLHSNPVMWAVIWGLPGLVLGLVFTFAPLVLLYRKWKGAVAGSRGPPLQRGWILGVLGAWAGFNVAGLTEWYFGDAESMLIYLILLGIALAPDGPAAAEAQGGIAEATDV